MGEIGRFKVVLSVVAGGRRTALDIRGQRSVMKRTDWFDNVGRRVEKNCLVSSTESKTQPIETYTRQLLHCRKLLASIY